MKTNVIVVTGPTGFRKGELVDAIIDDNIEFARIVSHTDRPLKEGEKMGKISFLFLKRNFQE